MWTHGNPAIFDKVIRKKSSIKKKFLSYLNISVNTFRNERSKVYELFSKKKFCRTSKPKSLQPYLVDLAKSKFVFSPRGNGIDCHRTWEALLLGAIPIVRTSPMNSIYDGLPVLIINDWSEVNQVFLEKKYTEMVAKQYSLEKLYFDYWISRINSFKVKK